LATPAHVAETIHWPNPTPDSSGQGGLHLALLAPAATGEPKNKKEKTDPGSAGIFKGVFTT
jgi:hypothetical protein